MSHLKTTKREKERQSISEMLKERIEENSLSVHMVHRLSGVAGSYVKKFVEMEFNRNARPAVVIFISAAIGLTEKELIRVLNFLGQDSDVHDSCHLFQMRDIRRKWSAVCGLRRRYAKAKKELDEVNELIGKLHKHDYRSSDFPM